VVGDSCDICYADFGESVRIRLVEQEPQPLRFSDVIDELRAAAALVRPTEDDPSRGIALACRRLEDLLDRLREQFLADLGVAG
jgi:hypothetical protein